MKHTLFIADLHLDEAHKTTAEIFKQFLKHQAIHAEGLYILGDFFEMWIGDDDTSPFHKAILESLHSLATQGIPIYFMRGNRDFLIGKRFAKETGCTLLPDPHRISLYGCDIVLTHGDALCTLDTKHMRFRKLTQNNLILKMVMCFPLWIREWTGMKLRAASRNRKLSAQDYVMDVVPDAVERMLQSEQVNYLVHGHTHKPNIHHLVVNNQNAERIVLGSWEQQGCALKWHADGTKELIYF